MLWCPSLFTKQYKLVPTGAGAETLFIILYIEHYRTVAIYRPSVSAHDILGPVNGAR